MHTPTAPPAWLQELRDADGRRLSERWQFFDQPVPFPPEWILSWGQLGLSVHRAGQGARSPVPRGREPTEAERAWAQSIVGAEEALAMPDRHGPVLGETDRAAWEDYLTLAQTLLQGVPV
jgi:hypothetical protein